MKRREFIKVSLAASTTLILPLSGSSIGAPKNKVNFGICADVHHDIMHDAPNRLQQFIQEASNNNLDFIIHLGDFCRPYEYNQPFMDIWNSYNGKRYHTLGNHDMDGGFSREQVVDFWKAKGKYYSFDHKGYHFIVLDGNDKNPSLNRSGGYARFVGKEQLQWLKDDLSATSLPCIVFSHQSFDTNDDGVENGEKIRALFEKANKAAGFNKVIAAFSGHHHTDYANQINGIYYIQINSMSYNWLGNNFKHIRYSKEIDKKHPWIKYTAPFKDPLYAFVKIDGSSIKIKGKKTKYVGPSPSELNYPKRPDNNPIVPYISNRKLNR
ncbi:alkaline phosphatase [Prolixibacteraceae bacterium JC049]|nr:alkaline phosphatase [Prolixibacteraceae bacterium JC049]